MVIQQALLKRNSFYLRLRGPDNLELQIDYTITDQVFKELERVLLIIFTDMDLLTIGT